ncbi:MAG: TlyA family RNA methyltransferase [Eubacteriales bacterium]|jgi:23S rRNA (cytidine1920-2'-O)/16S rRNA (cytidine1409-2'-O)-methyltransferase
MPENKNMRADAYIYATGHTRSRQRARELIEAGLVTIDGRRVIKPSEQVDAAQPHNVAILQEERYVSRGGLKLEAALRHFKIDVSGMLAVDIGASTGGFTDCLLQHGAARVIALDSGSGQLAPSLRSDSRVLCIEKFNARRLCEGDTGPIPAGTKADIVTIDVSFISQTYIIPGLKNILRDKGYFISLIKPQFEAGQKAVGRGGIVRDKKYHLSAIKKVVECTGLSGFGCLGVIRSPIAGGDGNIEYLAAYMLGGDHAPPDDKTLKNLISNSHNADTATRGGDFT